jgi:transposase
MLTSYNTSDIITVTLYMEEICQMDSKASVLKKSGSFNANHEKVTADIFAAGPFFDKRDIIQVKYEMIRAASRNEDSVTAVAGAFGFSRKGYYQANESFESGGLHALIPKKTGPKGPHKLKRETLDFVDTYVADHQNAKSVEISAELEARSGVKVHPRTISRYLEKKASPRSRG